MKNLRLGLLGLGLVGLLSACTVTVTLPDPIGGNASNTLKLTGLGSFKTNYQLDKAYTDQNGNTLASGSYVICDNKNTELSVNVTWTGDLRKLYVQLKGLTTGEAKPSLSASLPAGTTTSGSAEVIYPVGPYLTA